MRERRSGRWWFVLLALALVPLACWQCGDDEEPATVNPDPAPSEPLAPEVPARTIDAPIPEEEPDAATTMPDAGQRDSGFFDAGRATASREPTPLELDAYLKKWRDALEPAMRGVKPVKAIVAESAPPPPKPKEETCEPGAHTLSLTKKQPIDYVIAVDTSGSMYRGGLKAASEFIARLEFGFAQAGGDYRLVVLAEPRLLQLPDAAIAHRGIASNDGLDILIASAAAEAPRWLDLTRPASVLRLLLITDDGPDLDLGPPLPRLQAALANRSFSFSVLGGFSVPVQTPVLMPQADVSYSICRPIGLDEGRVYQQVAKATGGYRGSLCSDPSRYELIDTLLDERNEVFNCAWSLPRDAELIDARATMKRGGRSDYLVREYSLSSCHNARRGYLLEPPELVVCPDTCTTLKQEEFDAIEVRLRCVK